MLCFIHAEIYKLKKSKSFYSCVVAAAAFALLMYSMLLLADNIQKGKLENGTGGVIVSMNNEEINSSSAPIWDTVHIMDLMQQIFAGDVLGCIISIFISIFVIREFTSGMLKNIVGKGGSRSSVYLAKLFVAILAAILIAMSGAAATLITGRLLIGADAFADGLLKKLPAYIGLQMLSIAAISSIFVLVGEISRTMAAGISFGICTASLPALLLNILDMQFTDSPISPSEFWPLTRMSQCTLDGISTSYVTETLLIALFWLVLTTGLGIWHFHHTDIK